MNRNGREDGQLSIDFLVGFTIFMLGLIMVANMVPGLMVGLRRTTAIDYDAVAYRTGAILAEDPGWPVYTAWEVTGNKGSIERFGLAVDKETPNVLSRVKINKFFGDELGLIYPDDYRSRLIFSDYPYRMNITLNVLSPSEIRSIGDAVPELYLGGYGYIQRVVRIKETPYIILDLNESYMNDFCVDNVSAHETQNFTIRLDLGMLMLKNMSPSYQFNPRVEGINITILNITSKLNNTGNDTMGYFFFGNCNASHPDEWVANNLTPPDNATLKEIRLLKNNVVIPEPESYEFNLSIGGVSYDNLTPSARIYNDTAVNLSFYPGVLPLDESSVLDIVLVFSDDPPPRMLINGTYYVVYNASQALQVPDLREGRLEVAIW